MPVKAGTQFTPEQILEAGRRAEAEGRIEYALQFYHHLADQHEGTHEAYLATEALARLEAPQPAPNEHARHGGNGVYYAHPPRPQHASHHLAPPPDTGRPISIAPLDVARRQPRELPPSVSDYRFARWLARLATWFGGLVMVLGLAGAAAAIAAPDALDKLPVIGGLLDGPVTGLTIAAVGLAMLVGGQLVRAFLEMALATRDIAAMMRAQGEAGGPRDDERPRRRPANRRM